MVYGKDKVVGAWGKGILGLLIENGGKIFKKKKNKIAKCRVKPKD